MPIEKSAMVGSQYAIIADKDELQWIKNLWIRDALSGYVPTKRKKIKALDQGG
jgi:hypothetical protein